MHVYHISGYWFFQCDLACQISYKINCYMINNTKLHVWGLSCGVNNFWSDSPSVLRADTFLAARDFCAQIIVCICPDFQKVNKSCWWCSKLSLFSFLLVWIPRGDIKRWGKTHSLCHSSKRLFFKTGEKYEAISQALRHCSLISWYYSCVSHSILC